MLSLIDVLRRIRWFAAKGLDADRIARILNREDAARPNQEAAWTPKMVLGHMRWA